MSNIASFHNKILDIWTLEEVGAVTEDAENRITMAKTRVNGPSFALS